MGKNVVLVIAVGCILTGVVASGLVRDYSVAGVVIDAGGTVVQGASVEAVPITEGGSAGNLGWAHVNSSGGFRLVLEPGIYVIRAKDEADGYPDPNFLFCSDPSANFPRISVEKSDTLTVRVVLGTKGGILEGDLRDALTQQPIPKAKVTIRDARNPTAFVEISADKMGHFRFTVPNKPLEVLAAATGYQTMQYSRDERLMLSGGEHRNILIELSPSHPQ